jgi:hypothetical protein
MRDLLEYLLLKASRGLASRIRLFFYCRLGLVAGIENRVEAIRCRRLQQIRLGDGNALTAGCWLFPLVEWIRWSTPRGYVAARNHWLLEANEEFFVSLDDDAWFVKGDELATAIDHMRKHKRVAALAFDIASPDAPTLRSRAEAIPTHMFIGCGHLLRMSAVREVGLYERNPGFYGGEEKDLSIRLLDRGWEIHFLPGVHVWHEKTSLARDQPAQHRSGVCNDLLFAVRRCPWPDLLWVVPGKAVNHLIFSLRHRLLAPCFAGLFLFARHIPLAIRTRSPVRRSTFAQFIRRSRRA